MDDAKVKPELDAEYGDTTTEALVGQTEFEHLEYDHKASHAKIEHVDCKQDGAHDVASDVIRKPQMPKPRPHKMVGPDKKSAIQRTHMKHPTSSQSMAPTTSADNVTMVDFRKLEERSLRRYCRFYKLVGNGLKLMSKEQLVDVVQRHFRSQVIEELVRAFKRPKNAN